MSTLPRLPFLFLITSLASLISAQALVINSVTEVVGSMNGGTGITLSPNLARNAILSSTDFTPFTFAPGNVSNIASLNDGSLGGGNLYPVSDTAVVVPPPFTPWTLSIALDLSGNPYGFSLTNIQLISGWTQDRVDQSFSLSYSTVSDPLNFAGLGSFSATTANSGYVTLLSSLTDSNGTLANHVGALKFTFSTVNNNFAAYREIQVFGVASIPEPSTYALLLGGFVFLPRLLKRRA